MDDLLPPAFFDATAVALMILGTVILVIYVQPWLIIPTLILFVIFMGLRRYYMRSARDVKRLEGVAKSPVFSHLSTTFHGLTTIRAFSSQSILRSALVAKIFSFYLYRQEFDSIQNIHSGAWYIFLSTTRWFGMCLDGIVVVFLAIVVYSLLILEEGIGGGDIGLVVSNAILLTGMKLKFDERLNPQAL